MTGLLTQNGAVSLVLTALLFLVGIGLVVSPIRIRGLDDALHTAVAIGIMVVAALVTTLLLVDLFAVNTLHESPNSILNTIATIFLGIVALAAFGAAIWLACDKNARNRWLNATTMLLMTPVIGFIAATMWLFADTAGRHPELDFLARVAATVCFVLVILVALAIAAIAQQANRPRNTGGI